MCFVNMSIVCLHSVILEVEQMGSLRRLKGETRSCFALAPPSHGNRASRRRADKMKTITISIARSFAARSPPLWSHIITERALASGCQVFSLQSVRSTNVLVRVKKSEAKPSGTFWCAQWGFFVYQMIPQSLQKFMLFF